MRDERFMIRPDRGPGDDAARKEVRETLARVCADALNLADDDRDVTIVLQPVADVGPHGGLQEKIVAAVDDGKRVRGAIVVVYCDDRCDAELQAHLAQYEQDAELRRKVAALREDQLHAGDE